MSLETKSNTNGVIQKKSDFEYPRHNEFDARSPEKVKRNIFIQVEILPSKVPYTMMRENTSGSKERMNMNEKGPCFITAAHDSDKTEKLNVLNSSKLARITRIHGTISNIFLKELLPELLNEQGQKHIFHVICVLSLLNIYSNSRMQLWPTQYLIAAITEQYFPSTGNRQSDYEDNTLLMGKVGIFLNYVDVLLSWRQMKNEHFVWECFGEARSYPIKHLCAKYPPICIRMPEKAFTEEIEVNDQNYSNSVLTCRRKMKKIRVFNAFIQLTKIWKYNTFAKIEVGGDCTKIKFDRHKNKTKFSQNFNFTRRRISKYPAILNDYSRFCNLFIPSYFHILMKPHGKFSLTLSAAPSAGKQDTNSNSTESFKHHRIRCLNSKLKKNDRTDKTIELEENEKSYKANADSLRLKSNLNWFVEFSDYLKYPVPHYRYLLEDKNCSKQSAEPMSDNFDQRVIHHMNTKTDKLEERIQNSLLENWEAVNVDDVFWAKLVEVEVALEPSVLIDILETNSTEQKNIKKLEKIEVLYQNNGMNFEVNLESPNAAIYVEKITVLNSRAFDLNTKRKPRAKIDGFSNSSTIFRRYFDEIAKLLAFQNNTEVKFPECDSLHENEEINNTFSFFDVGFHSKRFEILRAFLELYEFLKNFWRNSPFFQITKFFGIINNYISYEIRNIRKNIKSYWMNIGSSANTVYLKKVEPTHRNLCKKFVEMFSDTKSHTESLICGIYTRFLANSSVHGVIEDSTNNARESKNPNLFVDELAGLKAYDKMNISDIYSLLHKRQDKISTRRNPLPAAYNLQKEISLPQTPFQKLAVQAETQKRVGIFASMRKPQKIEKKHDSEAAFRRKPSNQSLQLTMVEDKFSHRNLSQNCCHVGCKRFNENESGVEIIDVENKSVDNRYFRDTPNKKKLMDITYDSGDKRTKNSINSSCVGDLTDMKVCMIEQKNKTKERQKSIFKIVCIVDDGAIRSSNEEKVNSVTFVEIGDIENCSTEMYNKMGDPADLSKLSKGSKGENEHEKVCFSQKSSKPTPAIRRKIFRERILESFTEAPEENVENVKESSSKVSMTKRFINVEITESGFEVPRHTPTQIYESMDEQYSIPLDPSPYRRVDSTDSTIGNNFDSIESSNF